MLNIYRVKCTLLLLCTISLSLSSCDEFAQQNNTKTVGLEDPNVDVNVKTALENGSVSEVVVRKDLLLFPVNAPNLVLAHSQEIHAVPHINGSNATDGKPAAAEVAEVNEYSLSELVNDTDNNDTRSQGIAIPASTISNDTKNDSVLEPGKLLEIVSGFNLSNGVSTEKIPVTSEVQNFSIPKHSIVDLLSKSLSPTDAPVTDSPYFAESNTNYLQKRSADYEEDGNENDEDVDVDDEYENTEGGEDVQMDDEELVKRSVDSDESDSSESDSGESSEESSTTEAGLEESIDSKDDFESTTKSSTTEADVRRSIDSEADLESTDKSTTESSTTETGVKRSIDSEADLESTDKSTTEISTTEDDDERSIDAEDGVTNSYRTEVDSNSTSVNSMGIDIRKRSIESDEDASDTESSTLQTTTSTDNAFYKRFAEYEEDDQDGIPNTTVFYDHAVDKTSIIDRNDVVGSSSMQTNIKENLIRHSEDDMDVAEDIVFRPLFKYRQETRQRYLQRYNSDYRNQYRYTDDSDYDR